MTFFLVSVLIHIPDLAGLAGLIAGLSLRRRARAIGACVIAAALISLLTLGPTQTASAAGFAWRFITNAPAAILVALFVNWLRFRGKKVPQVAPAPDR